MDSNQIRNRCQSFTDLDLLKLLLLHKHKYEADAYAVYLREFERRGSTLSDIYAQESINSGQLWGAYLDSKWSNSIGTALFTDTGIFYIADIVQTGNEPRQQTKYREEILGAIVEQEFFVNRNFKSENGKLSKLKFIENPNAPLGMITPPSLLTKVTESSLQIPIEQISAAKYSNSGYLYINCDTKEYVLFISPKFISNVIGYFIEFDIRLDSKSTVSSFSWIKLIATANSAQGIREAMKLSFHRCMAESYYDPNASISQRDIALFRTMAARFELSGRRLTQELLWLHIFPFTRMKGTIAIDALAEYAVFLERPKKAKIVFLQMSLYAVFSKISKTDPSSTDIFDSAKAQGVNWSQLLSDG